MPPRRKNRYVFGRDTSPHRARRFFRGLILTLLILLVLGTMLNFALARNVALETVWVSVPNLPAEIEEFSILHLSDLHGVTLGENQGSVAQAISGQRFSCCVITGDMLGRDGEMQPLLSLLSVIPEGTLTVYVPGDEDPPYLDATAHGSISPLAAWAEQLQDAGVAILDTPRLIARGRNGRARVWLIPESLYALDLDTIEHQYTGQLNQLNAITALTPDQAATKRVCQYQLERISAIRQAVKDMKEDDVRIVISHTPVTREHMQTLLSWIDRGDALSIRHASLILAGHFCGGQWRLPWIGPVWVPDCGWFPGDSGITGLTWINGIPEYVSPGLGASGAYEWMPFRLFNRPVVTKIYLSSYAH